MKQESRMGARRRSCLTPSPCPPLPLLMELTTFCATRKQKIRFSLQGSFQDRRSTQIKERSVNNRYTDLDSSMVSVSVCGLILYLSAVSFSTRARGARILNMTLILVHSHQTTENSGTVPVR